MYTKNIKHNICIFASKISKLIHEHCIIEEKTLPYLYPYDTIYAWRACWRRIT
ncbi:hypothetical protein SPHINGO8BC_90005 [Sphingobacterium multivorum]|uniref:Uncharacterized protein n=1 Tax=Sphingobacterium multivorum TaxID=28454 RepID=A0A654DNF5_SPHMU|nr:hypothetical protein SPHINGO8BC_90005 [Sphingobacterium multivorum]